MRCAEIDSQFKLKACYGYEKVGEQKVKIVNKSGKVKLLLASCLLCSSAAWGNTAPAHGAPAHNVTAPLIDLGAELKPQEQNAPAATHAAPAPAPASHAPAAPAHGGGHAVHWSYSGEGGPQNWGDLDDRYHQCKVGKNQSPIDLRDAKAIGTSGLPELDIHYRPVPMKIINNGHTVQINFPLGSYIKVGGHRFELLQFHFHTPSEHQKEGFSYPMEVHLVHKDGDGNLAVMGILFQEGEANPFLQDIVDHLPTKVKEESMYREVEVNPVRLLPTNKKFYKYSGSLTTPPCSEGVYWMVFKFPIEASYEQLKAMNELMGDNARPAQGMFAREALKSWMVDQPNANQMYEFY